MKKALKIVVRMLIVILAVIAVLAIVTVLYMRQQKFGSAPAGARLERIRKSPHYQGGKFVNLSPTTTLVKGYSMLGVSYNSLIKSHPRLRPVAEVPHIKTDLLHLPPDSNILVWFGHSSYFMQLNGKTILVDPVFSGSASPVPGTVKSFAGTDIYTVADLPAIDYLFISHDHYDHLDYETITALKPKVGRVICGLGVGSHFEAWGYPLNKIDERDWYETLRLDGITVHTAPARHFSGRGFSEANTLWMSYLIVSPTLKIYVGGDSGYDKHFAEIGEKYGPIDLALLDNGQHNVAWQLIHTLPHEVLQAAKDLKAKRLFPVHSSKFVLATHTWDEPLVKITELNKATNIPLVTPIVGQPVYLNNPHQEFRQWWVGME